MQGGVAQPNGQSEITERTAQIMHETKPWTTFLAVLGFVGIGFMVLAGVGVALMSLVTGQFSSVFVGLVYFVYAIIYAYPVLKLWNYSKAIGTLLSTRKDADLEIALDQQRAVWRFMGIVTIVGMVLGLIGGIVAVGVGAFVAASAAGH